MLIQGGDISLGEGVAEYQQENESEQPPEARPVTEDTAHEPEERPAGPVVGLVVVHRVAVRAAVLSRATCDWGAIAHLSVSCAGLTA